MTRLLLAPLVIALAVCSSCGQLSSWFQQAMHQVPRFESAPCPFDLWGDKRIECGFVVVPKDHNDPDGPTIRLATAIVKDQGPGHRPDPVILLSGDGAFTFTPAELECATRQGLPFVVVLADDQAWGIVVSGQSRRYGADNMCGCQLGPIRYDQLAESLGCIGVRIEAPGEIGPAIERGLKADRPTVVHVPIATGGPADE